MSSYCLTTFLNNKDCYDHDDDLNKALEYYKLSLEMRKSVYKNENHLDIARSFNRFALLLFFSFNCSI